MDTMIRSWIVILFFYSCCCVQVLSQDLNSNQDSYKVHQNLHFSKNADQLTLDLYVPKDTSEPTPCIIVIQGGGFKSQDGQRFTHYAKYIAEQGYAAALISYRGIPDYKMPTTMSDIKESVRYVREISGKHYIDPTKIGAMGRSAGATLTMLLAVSNDSIELDSKDEGRYSSNIQAAAGCAGVYDFISRFSDSTQVSMQTKVNERKRTNGNWIGTPFLVSDPKWHKASVINNLNENAPSIFLLQCKDDTSVPWMQAKIMDEKMKEQDLESKVLYYEDGGHGFNSESSKDHKKEMIQFFRSIFQ